MPKDPRERQVCSFNIWLEKGGNQYYQLLEAVEVHVSMNMTLA